MNGYFCPVEGCEFGRHEEKTQSQVTRHINAKSGEDHADVDQLRQQVADQGEEDDEGNEDSDSGEPEEDDPGDEQSADTESDPEEGSDMPTDEEYKQQYERQDQGDDDGEDHPPQGDSSGGGFLGSLTPNALSTPMLLLIIGLTIVIVLYYARSGGESAKPDPEEVEPETESDDTETFDATFAGGA